MWNTIKIISLGGRKVHRCPVPYKQGDSLLKTIRIARSGTLPPTPKVVVSRVCCKGLLYKVCMLKCYIRIHTVPYHQPLRGIIVGTIHYTIYYNVGEINSYGNPIYRTEFQYNVYETFYYITFSVVCIVTTVEMGFKGFNFTTIK